MLAGQKLMKAAACVGMTLMAAGCLEQPETEAGEVEGIYARGDRDLQWWRAERQRRQAAIDAYIANNRDEWDAFKNAPVGNTGVPTIMLRLFPEIFPEIWGPYSAYMPGQGFGPDGLEPGRKLPLGLGHMDSNTPIGDTGLFFQSSSLSCAGCHLGRVDGPDGQIQYLPGAPNGQFGPFRGSVTATALDTSGRYDAQVFRDALAALPLGEIYGLVDGQPTLQEMAERQAFMTYVPEYGIDVAGDFLAALRAGALAGYTRYARTVLPYTIYNVPNPPAAVPGNLDALAAAFSLVVDPDQLVDADGNDCPAGVTDGCSAITPAQLRERLALAPAPVDIMSVWRQSDRVSAQWDGSIAGKLHRNLAASLGVIGNPAAVNVDAAVASTDFTETLPAPPYPFDVSRKKAKKGKKVYEQYCAGCHESGSKPLADLLFDPEDVGTDPNRAEIWTSYVVDQLSPLIVASCQGDPRCDDEPLPAVVDTGKYMAVPLTGIWASAPYLHNGSVPTLYGVITGQRDRNAEEWDACIADHLAKHQGHRHRQDPAIRANSACARKLGSRREDGNFYRGNTAYDQRLVGFRSDAPITVASELFDVTRAGNSNVGHYYGPKEDGRLSWKPRDVENLLEYLKTL